MSVQFSDFNPFSSVENFAPCFHKLSTKKKVIIGLATALTSLVSLPIFAILGVATFRALTRKFSKVVISNEIPNKISEEMKRNNPIVLAELQEKEAYPLPQIRKLTSFDRPASSDELISNLKNSLEAPSSSEFDNEFVQKDPFFTHFSAITKRNPHDLKKIIDRYILSNFEDVRSYYQDLIENFTDSEKYPFEIFLNDLISNQSYPKNLTLRSHFIEVKIQILEESLLEETMVFRVVNSWTQSYGPEASDDKQEVWLLTLDEREDQTFDDFPTLTLQRLPYGEATRD